MSNKKVVTTTYAKNNFRVVGLVLIIYCLIVLYLPYALKWLIILNDKLIYKGYNAYFVISLICLLIGTIVPFLFLSLYSKKKIGDFIKKADFSFKDIIVDFIVFFAICALAIYCMTMLGELFTIEGELISSIGVSFNTEYMSDYLYLFTFIILTPILEEYAFRGVLLTCLSTYGKYFALIATSMIYGLAHGSLIEFIPSFVMSIFLCKLTLRYKSIRPSLIIHIMFNASLCLLSIIPAKYSLYTMIGLTVMLVIAIVLVITRTYHHITVKKAKVNNQISLTFFSSYTVVIAALLFISYTILLMFVAQ